MTAPLNRFMWHKQALYALPPGGAALTKESTRVAWFRCRAMSSMFNIRVMGLSHGYENSEHACRKIIESAVKTRWPNCVIL